MLRITLAALLLVAATPSFAGDCQTDIAAVDKALQEDQALAPEQRAQVQDMRSQAAQLCGAGNEQEGVDILAEAKAMLTIE